VLIPKARITPKQLPASTRSTSSDLVVLNEKHEQQAIQSLGPDIQVTLRLGEDVHFSGFDFSAYIDGHLEVIGHPQQAMIGNGQLLIRDGRYQTHHTTLTVERGRINFSQSPIDNPALNIRTVRQIDDVQVGVEIGGRAQEPTLKLFSTPSMPQKDILSYLATGEALDTGSFSTRGALTSLGVLGTNMLAGDLGKELGIDEIALESDSDDIKDSKVRLGKHISENLSIGVRVGLDPEDTEVTAAYRFDRHWEVDASTSLASSALDAKFTIDIK
jgi:translocation and assembly module TamB